MISWQTAAHWPYVEAPFPFYLVFYGRDWIPVEEGRTFMSPSVAWTDSSSAVASAKS